MKAIESLDDVSYYANSGSDNDINTNTAAQAMKKNNAISFEQFAKRTNI